MKTIGFLLFGVAIGGLVNFFTSEWFLGLGPLRWAIGGFTYLLSVALVYATFTYLNLFEEGPSPVSDRKMYAVLWVVMMPCRAIVWIIGWAWTTFFSSIAVGVARLKEWEGRPRELPKDTEEGPYRSRAVSLGSLEARWWGASKLKEKAP